MAFGDVTALGGGQTATATFVDIPLPAGIALGDLLVLAVTNGTPQTYATITLAPSGAVSPAWTVLANSAHSALGSGCWCKPASSYDVTNAGGSAKYRVSLTTGSHPMAWVILLVKGAGASTQRTAYIEQPSPATNTSITPTALTGVAPADLTLELYEFAEQTRNLNPAGDAIMNYPASAPTWAQVIQAKTAAAPATTSGLWDSAIAVISKFGGGLAGDVPNAGSGSARTGTFSVNSLSLAAPRTDRMMPLFV
jgi:hypothetical protein